MGNTTSSEPYKITLTSFYDEVYCIGYSSTTDVTKLGSWVFSTNSAINTRTDYAMREVDNNTLNELRNIAPDHEIDLPSNLWSSTKGFFQVCKLGGMTKNTYVSAYQSYYLRSSVIYIGVRRSTKSFVDKYLMPQANGNIRDVTNAVSWYRSFQDYKAYVLNNMLYVSIKSNGTIDTGEQLFYLNPEKFSTLSGFTIRDVFWTYNPSSHVCSYTGPNAFAEAVFVSIPLVCDYVKD